MLTADQAIDFSTMSIGGAIALSFISLSIAVAVVGFWHFITRADKIAAEAKLERARNGVPEPPPARRGAWW